jgi:hypothetical protein
VGNIFPIGWSDKPSDSVRNFVDLPKKNIAQITMFLQNLLQNFKSELSTDVSQSRLSLFSRIFYFFSVSGIYEREKEA